MSKHTYSSGIEVLGAVSDPFATVLTPEALDFVATLHRAFDARRQELLRRRDQRQADLAAGKLPDFLPETAEIRAGTWRVASIPPDLMDRRVEITGPVDRKMIINALNSGARVFMADFEDANSPTWDNNIQGQINLRDAINRSIDYVSPEGKAYKLNDTIATLLVRPRGWHLVEKHVRVDGQPVSGSLFDFGLYFFHNAKTLLAKGSGPYFYLPKMESHREARLWNDVFVLAQDRLGVPQGSIRATVLIETILAAFEMDEILYELRDHSAGLNCGRWDYIFSCIKKLRGRDHVFPDRALVTMTTHFMRSYSLLAIKTCHRREIHAVGGMSAFIPVKNDPAANERAFAQVRADKEREANDGHDGTWVAHPGMVALATEAFDAVMKTPNQIDKKREDVQISAADLLDFVTGPITEAGLRTNISVGIQYIEAWLGGQGAVPIFNLMEDAATAEISRSQVWQWIHSPKGVLDPSTGSGLAGRKITVDLTRQLIAEELEKIKAGYGPQAFAKRDFARAAELFDTLTSSPEFTEFLTLPGYGYLD
jgi:malate synthase